MLKFNSAQQLKKVLFRAKKRPGRPFFRMLRTAKPRACAFAEALGKSLVSESVVAALELQ
jgi:hypothetical protein